MKKHPPGVRGSTGVIGVLAALITLAAGAAQAATFTVTSNADSGPGTLRAAIESARGLDSSETLTVTFAIAGPAPHRIMLQSPLPDLDSLGNPAPEVFIDGRSQAGYEPAGDSVIALLKSRQFFPGKPVVILDGSLIESGPLMSGDVYAIALAFENTPGVAIMSSPLRTYSPRVWGCEFRNIGLAEAGEPLPIDAYAPGFSGYGITAPGGIPTPLLLSATTNSITARFENGSSGNNAILYYVSETPDYTSEMHLVALRSFEADLPSADLVFSHPQLRLPPGSWVRAVVYGQFAPSAHVGEWGNAVQIPCSIELSPSAAELPGDPGSTTINVATGPNCSWSIASLPSWASAKVSSGSGDAALLIDYTANETGATRAGFVILQDDLGTGYPVALQQLQVPCSIEVSPAATELSGEPGSTVINVATGPNCSWSIASLPSWASAKVTSGSGDAALSITFSANETGATRSGFVILQDELGATYPVAIQQLQATTTGEPVLAAVPASVSVPATIGGELADIVLTLNNGGYTANYAVSSTARVVAETTTPWLTAVLSTDRIGLAPATLTLRVDTSRLTSGVNSTLVRLRSHPDALVDFATVEIPVAINVPFEQPATLPAEWYFAEGYTGSSFETFFLLANSSEEVLPVQVEFHTQAGATVTINYPLPPQSRYTLQAGSVLAAETAFSTVIRNPAGGGFAAERAMYSKDASGSFDGGHTSTPLSAPATEWYVPEGASLESGDIKLTTYILIANSSSQSARVTVDYLFDDRTPLTYVYTVPARSRFTLNPRSGLNAAFRDRGFAARIRSTRPVIVERSSWWGTAENPLSEGSCSPGIATLATTWYIPFGGSAAEGSQDYTLLMNPGTAAAQVSVTHTAFNSEEITFPVTVAAGRRVTLGPPSWSNDGADVSGFSTVVRPAAGATARAIAVERVSYTNAADPQSGAVVYWAAGHSTEAARRAGRDWLMPEAFTRIAPNDATNTFVVIQRSAPGFAPLTATVQLQFQDGRVVLGQFLGTGSSLLVDVAELLESENPMPYSIRVRAEENVIVQRVTESRGAGSLPRYSTSSLGILLDPPTLGAAIKSEPGAEKEPGAELPTPTATPTPTPLQIP